MRTELKLSRITRRVRMALSTFELRSQYINIKALRLKKSEIANIYSLFVEFAKKRNQLWDCGMSADYLYSLYSKIIAKQILS